MADITSPLGDSVEDILSNLEKESREEESNEEIEEESSQGKEEELSEIEQEAMEAGWVKEGIKGKRYKTAEEYLETKELLDTISSQNRKLKSLTNTVGKYKEVVKKSTSAMFNLQKKAYEQALATLKKEKRQAERQQEFDTADEAEEQIKSYEQELKKIEDQEKDIDDEEDTKTDVEARVQEFKDYWVEWQESNEWVSDKALENSFVKFLNEEVEADPDIEPGLAFRRAKAAVKLKHPGRIGGKSKASPTGNNRSGTEKTSKSNSPRLGDFSQEDQDVIRQMAKSVGLSVNDYLKLI